MPDITTVADLDKKPERKPFALPREAQKVVLKDLAKAFEAGVADESTSEEDRRDLEKGRADVNGQFGFEDANSRGAGEGGRELGGGDDPEDDPKFGPEGAGARGKAADRGDGDSGRAVDTRRRSATGRFQSDGEADPEALVALNYRGHRIEKAVKDVVALAQKGLDYETKMRELRQENGDFKDYISYRDYLKAKPELATAMGALMEAYENTGAVPRMVVDRGELAASEVEVVPGQSEIAKRTARVENWIKEQQSKARVDATMQAMTAIIDRTPILRELSARSLATTGKSGKPRDLALEKLVQAHMNDPEADLELLAEAVATDIRQTHETLAAGAAYVSRKAEERKRFTAESPAGAPATTGTSGKQRMTGADLKSGAVRNNVLAFLKNAAGLP